MPRISAPYVRGGRNIPSNTPDLFVFDPITGVAPLSSQISNEITITGINVAVPINVTGGQYSLNGGSYTTATNLAIVGDKVRVKGNASSISGVTKNIILTVGSRSAIFAVTSLAVDTTPDSFTFISKTDVPLLSTVTSTAVLISGINSATPISISGGGSYSINGGAFTSSAGTINDNDQVQCRLTSSNLNSTTSTATLTIGDITGTFSVTTAAATRIDISGTPTQATTGNPYVYQFSIMFTANGGVPDGTTTVTEVTSGILDLSSHGLTYNGNTGIISGTPS